MCSMPPPLPSPNPKDPPAPCILQHPSFPSTPPPPTKKSRPSPPFSAHNGLTTYQSTPQGWDSQIPVHAMFPSAHQQTPQGWDSRAHKYRKNISTRNSQGSDNLIKILFIMWGRIQIKPSIV